jgi:hypothetical protein
VEAWTTTSGSLGGGIWSDGGTVNLKNTIVAGNSTGGDCATGGGAAITSLGYNLASDGTCNLSAVGDQPSTAPLLGPLASNGGRTQTHAPLLGPLASNGGRTQTHAPLNGSPVLDAVPKAPTAAAATTRPISAA